MLRSSQPDVKSHYARTPQDLKLTFEIDLDHLWGVTHYGKYAKKVKKNHFAALQTKQAKRAWLISKENCIWKWDIFDYFQALWENELLPQCVSDRVEKELWEM